MTYAVHPAAAVFPMLPDDELQALADDIAANGLQQPLVLTPDGALLDGRNRLAACALAGVEAWSVVHDGDPVAYVLSANNHRRHMNKGQRALAGVLALDSGALIISRDVAAKSIGVSHGLVGWARTVVQYGPSLIPDVFRDVEPLSLKAAYDKATVARDATTAEAIGERLAALEQANADLAAQVRDGALSIAAAEVEMRERKANAKRDRRDGLTAAERLRTSLLADVASVLGARQLGEPIDTTDLIDNLRRAADALEGAT